MRRTLPLLISLLIATSALAGCFHGDEGQDHDDDNGTDTSGGGDNNTTADNNTTFPPDANEAPVPSFEVTFETGENTTTGNRVAVAPNSNLTIVLDGSASTDPDGEIAGYAWTVTGPGTTEETSSDAVFRLNLTSLNEFGAWNVTLKVLDDRSTIATLTQTMAIDYTNTLDSVYAMRGPASGDIEGDDQEANRVGTPVGDEGIESGTYYTHTVSVGADVESIAINGTYDSSGLGADIQVHFFEPGADTTSDDPIASSEVGSDGTVSLSVDGTSLNETGRYTVRVDLDGNGNIDRYSLDVLVKYALPMATDGHAHTH